MRLPHLLLTAAVAVGTLLLAGCGEDDTDPAVATPAADLGATGSDGEADPGIRVVPADEAAALLDEAPDDLVVLDVRTPAEYAEGHLEGAVLVDFEAPDFAERLADLDPDVPYVLYCRSGNRSAGARAAMAELGFRDVADIDGGILAWADAGLPVTTG